MADVIVKILCAGGFDVDHRMYVHALLPSLSLPLNDYSNEDLLKLRSAYCRKELGSMLPRVHGSPKTLPIIADPPAISNAIQTILVRLPITKQTCFFH